jgi:tetratricopeptide (TPR) repeat protein
MSSKVPTIKQIAWISLIPQLGLLALLMAAYYYFEVEEFILYGAATYLVISYLLRTQIPKQHREGMFLVKRQDFAAAIPRFEKSFDYFTKNEWIDKYRYFILLSSSRASYKEMALINIAFCYSQIGDGDMAKKYYNKTLDLFPGSMMASTALKMIKSVEK